jgi:hypothetical protein
MRRLLGFLLLAALPAAAASTATTTTLAVASAGAPVTKVKLGTVIALTATVKAGTTALTQGQVNFCDATAKYCTDIHLLGTAQLTSAGTAVFRFRPGLGSQKYKAVFLGTPNGATDYAGSSSAASSLTVTSQPTTDLIPTVSGSGGTYQVTAQVFSRGNHIPTGTITYTDTTEGNAVLATTPIDDAGGSVSWPHQYSTGIGEYLGPVVAGDFNGDGILDLVTTYSVDDGEGGYVVVFLGSPGGTFTNTSPFYVGNSALTYLAVGDFNGDGFLDFAFINANGGLGIELGNGKGDFTAAGGSSLPYISATSLAVADFNGDGILDLAVGSSYNPYFDGSVTILLGNGDGTFYAASAFPLPDGAVTPNPGGTSLAVGDYNGDGIPDIAATISTTATVNPVTVMLGNGDGTFTAAASPQIAGDPILVAAADFNGDGFLDLAVLTAVPEPSQPGHYTSGLTMLLGNGHGVFTPSSVVMPTPLYGESGESMSVSDFTGDGIPDLAVEGYGSLSVLPGVGDGTFLAPLTVAATDVNYFTVGDFNGDGAPDLAYVGYPAATLVSAVTSALNPPVVSSFTLQPGGSGIHQVKAFYSGDPDHLDVSTILPLAAPIGTPEVAIFSPVTSVAYGTTVTFSVAVIGPGLTPTGTIMLYDGGSPVAASCTLASGVATCPVSTLVPGTFSITAWYSGDKNYAPGVSTGVKVTVTKATVTVTAKSLSKVLGAAVPALTYTLGGFVHGDTAATAVNGAPKLTTTATKTSPAGIYPIAISAGTLSAARYSFVFKNGTLTVKP